MSSNASSREPLLALYCSEIPLIQTFGVPVFSVRRVVIAGAAPDFQRALEPRRVCALFTSAFVKFVGFTVTGSPFYPSLLKLHSAKSGHKFPKDQVAAC